ncbi:MAG: efflux RND transporter periplasmic adaptor subunit, partial [Hyphomicrobiales bacterium]|nr:efflux RND transporter periplasmic adaptor subunit [Hyphomicrobiales bacterium]
AMAAGDVPVAALGVDGTTTVDSGRLTTIDNAVDPTTGTVKMRAEFPNAGLKLWPGQYVEVRVVVRTLKHVVSVPVSAVQRGPDGAFVYAVAGDAAKLTPVTVVQQDDMTAVIGTGLTPPVKVVTTGFAQLTDGAKIALPGPPAADAGSGAGKPAAGGGKAGGAKRGKARDAAAVAQ